MSPHRSRLILVAAAAAALLPGGCAGAPAGGAPPPRAAVSETALRHALGKAYDRNRRALLARDAAAVLALRTADFAVETPDGKVHGAAEMAGFTRDLLARVARWEALSFDLLWVARQGADAAAEVRQHSIRLMRRPEGRIQRVENWVTQRETWTRTRQGWRIRRVDHIREQWVLVDGVPRA
ncbi:MAG: hypothetical protein JOZ90_16085 [Alphaproteobacteria bacterium]|nr:hypothetical protein [Alphaproteobacteria bacterium]MBV9373365.1 hypothetical protein [Alphaproteobacteria bacterium]MBV9902594.1 hypothetical protein [Alphaproteobacteria bacterium]